MKIASLDYCSDVLYIDFNFVLQYFTTSLTNKILQHGDEVLRLLTQSSITFSRIRLLCKQLLLQLKLFPIVVIYFLTNEIRHFVLLIKCLVYQRVYVRCVHLKLKHCLYTVTCAFT